MRNFMNYSFPELVSIVGGKGFGQPDEDLVVRYLLTDSRQLIAPSQSLFFAIRTRKNDGHRYVAELLGRGVRMFVVSYLEKQWLSDHPGAGFILTGTGNSADDPAAGLHEPDLAVVALQKLAAHHRLQFRYPVVGITGSNGKTIVKEWLFQLLHDHVHIIRNPKSYNSQIGVPLAVWQMSGRDQLGLFEAGISRPGEMALLEKVIHPTMGIFTNIGPAHDSGFTTRKEKIREKLRLFEGVETLVYCADHTGIHAEIMGWVLQQQGGSAEAARASAGNRRPAFFTWGRAEGVDLRVVDVVRQAGDTSILVHYHGKDFSFSIPFPDEASVENALHCASVMLLMGLPAEAIQDKMPRLQAVAMRLELKEGINQCTIINDSYNSDLSSLAIAMDFLNSQTRHKRTTLILSDILQSGMDHTGLYGQVAAMVKAKGVDRLIGIGPDISSQAALFEGESHFYPDTNAFIRLFDFSGFSQEAILLKGARPFAFEKLSGYLQQKDHQTILEVDLDALVHNLNVYKSQLKDGVRVMGMVKAFSYGSGSVEVARILQYHHVEYLAVAYADEGKELRKGGVHIPIVVMNPEVRHFDTLLTYRLEPEIYSMDLLKRFVDGIQPLSGDVASACLNIHLKIDTGMHRLGFLPGQVPALIAFLQKNRVVRLASVFTHLAASDDPVHDDFTREQIQTFRLCCDQLAAGLESSFLRHVCNSAAVSRFPEAQHDMVRLGIGLYGVSHDPVTQGLLQHVSTFKSVISQIKHISRGETIGYNRAGVADKDMVIAIVPVGYADGLNRRLGNGAGTLVVSGRHCPIVGNISMDMCAIDVTGLQANPGDEVIVFGRERSVQELARDLETIPYEVLTSVSHRVKRVYLQG